MLPSLQSTSVGTRTPTGPATKGGLTSTETQQASRNEGLQTTVLIIPDQPVANLAKPTRQSASRGLRVLLPREQALHLRIRLTQTVLTTEKRQERSDPVRGAKPTDNGK